MLITLIGRLVQFALMLASVRIMTELLSQADVGRIALLTTTTSLFALFLVNPVGMFYNRRLHAWMQAGTARKYFHLYIGYLLAVCVLAMAALWAAARMGLGLGGTSLGWVAFLVGGSLFFNTMIQTLVPSLNMVGRPRPFIALTLGCLIIGLIASVLLSRIAGASAEHWLAGTLLAQVLFSFIAYRVFFDMESGQARPDAASLDLAKLKHMAAFCWPIAIAVLLQWAHTQGYRFLLSDEFGLAQLGLYAAGYGIAASLMSAAETILTTWFQPQFYRDANSNSVLLQDQAWSTYAAVMIPASLLSVTALIAVAPSLPRLMLGSEFHDTGNYVILGALAEWARVMVGMVSLNAHRRMSTRMLILPNALGAITTYATLFALLRSLGMMAAPLAVCFGGLSIIAYLYRVSYANDVHAKINFNHLAWTAVALSICAAVIAGSQLWLLNLDSHGIPFLAFTCVVIIWSFLTWRLMKPAFDNRMRHP